MLKILPSEVHLANHQFIISFYVQNLLVYVFHIRSASCSATFLQEVIFKQFYVHVPNFGLQHLKTIFVANKMAFVLYLNSLYHSNCIRDTSHYAVD